MIAIFNIFVVNLIVALWKIDTVKLIPKNLVTYKVFGEPEGPHYAHYDLVGGRQVVIFVTSC